MSRILSRWLSCESYSSCLYSSLLLTLDPIGGFYLMHHTLMHLVLAATLALTGCSDSLDRPIHFVVPDGYSGPFVVIANPKFPERIEKYSDRYELKVPQDGIFRTNNTDIFQIWHKTTAAYRSGERFPADEHGNSLLFAGPTGARDSVTYISWYYVGPYCDFHDFMYSDVNSKNRFKWLEERDLSY